MLFYLFLIFNIFIIKIQKWGKINVYQVTFHELRTKATFQSQDISLFKSYLFFDIIIQWHQFSLPVLLSDPSHVPGLTLQGILSLQQAETIIEKNTTNQKAELWSQVPRNASRHFLRKSNSLSREKGRRFFFSGTIELVLVDSWNFKAKWKHVAPARGTKDWQMSVLCSVTGWG